MNEPGPLQKKSYDFALAVTLFCKNIIETKKEYILSRKLMKSGTSIGACIEEAQHAESKRDFISKLSISLKEAYESRYWLRLIRDAKYTTSVKVEPLLSQVNQIIPILIKSIKTAKDT